LLLNYYLNILVKGITGFITLRKRVIKMQVSVISKTNDWQLSKKPDGCYSSLEPYKASLILNRYWRETGT
jgi:hypothetical protein